MNAVREFVALETTCPECSYKDRTTVCRFCGISKLPKAIRKPLVPCFAVAAKEPPGAIEVKFATVFRERKVDVRAVIAPADPEVGLVDPYPVAISVFNETGGRMNVTYREARALIGEVVGQLF